MRDLNTAEAGIRNGQKEEIAIIGVEKENEGWLATNTGDLHSKKPKKTPESMKKMI